MKRFCLDTNVFIEGWNRYYSIDLCPQYWQVLDSLAKEGIIFSPIEVKHEILKTDDGLANWIKSKDYIFKDITVEVQECLRKIMESHGNLAALAAIDSSSYGYLGEGDRALLRDAIALECDTFLTMENKLPKNAGHIERTLGLRVLSPTEMWAYLQPWAALFR